MNRAAFVTSLSAGALTGVPRIAFAADRFAAAHTAIAALAAKDEFSGVAAVYEGTKPLFQKGYGLANRSDAIPNTPATRFNIASLCKLFTTAIIAQYVRDGRIALTDTVGKHLPTYPNASVRDRVTIDQLIHMRGGVPDFFNERFRSRNVAQIDGLADYLPLFADLPLEFEPGTKEAYSNGGFLILGLIIEATEGTSYYAAVQRKVFAPAGMTDSAFFGVRDIAPRVAIGYSRDLGTKQWLATTADLPGRGSSAGGGYSTTLDLARFVDALDRGTLSLDTSGAARPGLNFEPWGGSPGANTVIHASRGGPTLIVLANMSPRAALPVLNALKSATSS